MSTQPAARARPNLSGNERIARFAEGIFLVWIALIPVMHPGDVRVVHRYTLPIDDGIFVLAAVAFAAALITGSHRVRRCTWHWALLAYAGALILSTVTSGNVRQNIPKLAGDLYLIVAAVIAADYARDAPSLRRMIFAWLAGSAATIVAAFAGVALFFAGVTTARANPFLFQFGSLPPGHYPRIRALFLNANMMCSFMTASVMLAIGARQAGWISRRVFLLLFWGGIGTAAFSISPGLGGLCLAIGLWQSLLQPTKARARLLAAAGVMAALLFLLSATISPTHLTSASLLTTILHPDPSARVLTWKEAWHSFLHHPWFGSGLESDPAQVRYLAASGLVHLNTDAQNTWLSVMAKQGLAGAVAFLWVVLYPMRSFRRFARPFRGLNAVRLSLGLAVIGAILDPAFTGSFENTRHVWALMGILAGIQELNTGEFRVIPD